MPGLNSLLIVVPKSTAFEANPINAASAEDMLAKCVHDEVILTIDRRWLSSV